MEAVLLTAPDGATLAANPAACTLLSRTEEDICQIGRAGLVDASSPHLTEMLAERASTGKMHGELILIRGDDSRFQTEVSSAQFTDTDGNIRTIIILRDLSETKRFERTRDTLLFEANKNAAEVEAILASQHDAILMYDMGMNVCRANRSFVNLYGFNPVGLNAIEIIQRTSIERFDGRPMVLADQPTPRALRDGMASKALYSVKQGGHIPAVIEVTSTPLYVDGHIVGSVSVWHDITELKRAEEALQKSSKEIEDLYEHAPCGYHSIDENGLFLRMNNTQLEWLGYRRDEVIGKMKMTDLLPPASLQIFQENFPCFKERGYVHDLEFEFMRKDGTVFPILLSATAIRDAAGRFVASRTTLFDLSERKKLERELARQAHIDMLTGLNNRRYFFELAELQLAQARRFEEPLSLLMLDLDNFKSVNDTYGHHIGDAALQTLSEVCLQTLREIDVIGRFGGEEFVALLPRTSSTQAMEVARRLLLAVESTAVKLGSGASIHFTVSIGVASFNVADAMIDSVLKRADIALYRAKSAGRNQVCIDE